MLSHSFFRSMSLPRRDVPTVCTYGPVGRGEAGRAEAEWNKLFLACMVPGSTSFQPTAAEVATGAQEENCKHRLPRNSTRTILFFGMMDKRRMLLAPYSIILVLSSA